MDDVKLSAEWCEARARHFETMAELPALNGGRHKCRLSYDEAEPEVKPSLLVLAELEDAVRKRKTRHAA